MLNLYLTITLQILLTQFTQSPPKEINEYENCVLYIEGPTEEHEKKIKTYIKCDVPLLKILKKHN